MKQLSKAKKFKFLFYFAIFGPFIGLIGIVFLFIDPLPMVVRILLMAVFSFSVAIAVTVIVSYVRRVARIAVKNYPFLRGG